MGPTRWVLIILAVLLLSGCRDLRPLRVTNDCYVPIAFFASETEHVDATSDLGDLVRIEAGASFELALTNDIDTIHLFGPDLERVMTVRTDEVAETGVMMQSACGRLRDRSG